MLGAIKGRRSSEKYHHRKKWKIEEEEEWEKVVIEMSETREEKNENDEAGILHWKELNIYLGP